MQHLPCAGTEGQCLSCCKGRGQAASEPAREEQSERPHRGNHLPVALVDLCSIEALQVPVVHLEGVVVRTQGRPCMAAELVRSPCSCQPSLLISNTMPWNDQLVPHQVLSGCREHDRWECRVIMHDQDISAEQQLCITDLALAHWRGEDLLQ